MDRLRQAIQRGKAYGRPDGADDPRPRPVQDRQRNLWSQGGDKVIETVAARLTRTLGPDQTVARMGGDEFAIILSNPEDRWQIEQTARDILKAIGDPIKLEDGNEAVLAGSLGITVCPHDGTHEEALLMQADTSMLQAKADSGASYRFFATRMNEQAARASQIEICLRQAIEKGELHLNFQPIVDYEKNRVVSCETLARWTDPKLAFVPPTEFIKVAEDCGLIVPLGEQVLREACEFFQSCNRNGLQLDGISVNISPRQCRDADFLPRLREILDETGMDPARLQLEVTESVMFDDHASTRSKFWKPSATLASRSPWMISAPATRRSAT